MTYWTAADLLEQVFPVDAAKHPETLRRHTLKAGEALAACGAIQPETPASAVVVTLDLTGIMYQPPPRQCLLYCSAITL
jgi:hypothetical protein